MKNPSLELTPHVVPLGSDRKPRVFLDGIDRIISELVGGHPFPWDDFEAPGLIAGAVGALGSWVSDGLYFYICNYLLALSGMYFFIMIPYFLDSHHQQQRQSVPFLAVIIGINALATGIRVGILEAPYNTKYFADPFHWYLGGLFAYCVFANVVMLCNKQGSNAPETNIEEFDAVKKHSLVNSKALNNTGDLLEGNREPLLPIQIV
jgi:hypothetical protein